MPGAAADDGRGRPVAVTWRAVAGETRSLSVTGDRIGRGGCCAVGVLGATVVGALAGARPYCSSTPYTCGQ